MVVCARDACDKEVPPSSRPQGGGRNRDYYSNYCKNQVNDLKKRVRLQRLACNAVERRRAALMDGRDIMFVACVVSSTPKLYITIRPYHFSHFSHAE